MRASVTASSGQDPRYGELQQALVEALALAGVPAEVSVDCFAAGAEDLVHVLVPAAYLPYVHDAAYPSPDQLRRTVLVVTESPGEPGFEPAAALAETAAATLVLDPAAAPELERRGVSARLLKLGYVPAWDAWGGSSAERAIDLAMLDDFSDRRALAVATAWPALEGRRTALHLARLPLTPASAAATPSGAARWELLANTRVLLTVHGAETRSFDWLAGLAAIANGCIVLSEQPRGHGPLVAGRHFETAEFHALPAAIEGLLGGGDEERLGRMRREAYDLMRAERPLSGVGEALREAGERALAAPGPIGARARIATPMPVPPPAPRPAAELLQDGNGGEGATVRAALKQALLRQRRLERELRRIEAGEDAVVPEDRVVEFGSPEDGWAPRVSVVVTLYNYAHTIAAAIRSVALQDLDDVELVLVDDASTDDSLAVARAALVELPWLRGGLVERGANGGLARARNLGVAHARAGYVFVLDADNEVSPAGLRALADALDADLGADFAYGLIRTVGPSGPMGLLSWAPRVSVVVTLYNYAHTIAAAIRSVALQDLDDVELVLVDDAST
ncbi:MAG: hypothetical protein QOF55_2218, partial [Thermoleophilaceae bacterium]|nr:hypothetical protein [Thermoleophilaceae bacterium]